MEDNPFSIYYLVITIFFFISIISSGLEAAILSADKVKINTLNNSFISKIIKNLFKNFDKFIITIIIMNLVSNILSSSISVILIKNILTKYFNLGSNTEIIFLTSTFFMTFMVLIFAEILPKRFFIKYSFPMIKFFSLFIYLIYYILLPFTYLFSHLTNFISALFFKTKKKDYSLTEEEIKYFLTTIEDYGVLEKTESNMLMNVVELNDSFASSLLIPRQDLIGIYNTEFNTNIIDKIKSINHSIIPVFDENKDNIIGILDKNNLSIKYLSNNNIKITKLITKINAVPETKKLFDCLKEMYNSNSKALIIVDEYGGTEGILTYYDIIKKYLGKLDNSNKSTDIIKISKNIYKVKAQIPIKEINDFFNIKIIIERYETLAGYIIEKMHKIPKQKDIYKDNFFIYTISNVTKRKINEIILTKL